MLGRLQKTEISDGSSIGYTFDKVNNVTNTLYKFGGVTKSTTYNHFKSGVVCDVTYPNGATKTRSLNGQAQVRRSTLTTPTGKTWSINRIYYTPIANGVSYTTNVMGSLIYDNINRTFSYAYNGSGNISKITDKVGTTAKESTFVYDEANQLIRENNAYTNKTVTYTYDAGGNILTKTEYPFTTGSLDNAVGTVVNYTYGNTNWKDLLTEFNGNQITYDQIGNPLSYYNGTTFTWERGRKLATATTADGTAISYKYNDSGIRTQKTVNGVATDYFLDGSKIVAEKTQNDTKWYYYDGDGTREAIEYNGNVYYYFYNAQGDVMGLYDNNLNVVVEYAYDSWGNTVSITGSLASTLGQDNPFRYRGYYFDSDTGLYYLNSRYYDANTGRFVNADGLLGANQDLLEYNLFAYCSNDPINCFDATGNGKIWNWIKDKYNSAVAWVEKKISNSNSKSSSVKKGVKNGVKIFGHQYAIKEKYIGSDYEYAEDVNNMWVYKKRGNLNNYVIDNVPKTHVSRYSGVDEYRSAIIEVLNNGIADSQIEFVNSEYKLWSELSEEERGMIYGDMVAWDTSAHRQRIYGTAVEATETGTKDMFKALR